VFGSFVTYLIVVLYVKVKASNYSSDLGIDDIELIEVSGYALVQVLLIKDHRKFS